MTTENTTENTTETRIIPAPNSGPLTQPGQPAGFQIEGLECLSNRDVILPRWSIVQPTSQREGAEQHLGQFWRNIDGECRATLHAVVLQVQPTRLLWAALGDAKPECVSRDGVNGSVYGPCGACQFNWLVNPALRENNTLKSCSAGYTMLLVDDVSDETMALFGAMGTSVKPAKILVTQFVQRKRPPFSALVEFTTELLRNDRGKYYVLRPRIEAWLPLDQTQHYRDLYLSVRGQTVRDLEDEPAADAADEPAPAF